MSFPMDDRMVLAYVGWLIAVRKVSSATISQYISGLRVAHLKQGVMPGNLKPALVAAVIKGKEHEEGKSETKIPRLAMSIPVMRLLKALLTQSSMALADKRLLWAISCMAFHGSFRIHELLSRSTNTFDPTTTLLGCNVRKLEQDIDGTKEIILAVHLKCPKEDKLQQGVTVELFSTKTVTCPVTAWLKWQKVSKVASSPTKPAFRREDGSCMTGIKFNTEIKSVLGKVINYNSKKYLSHSFRAGLASMMASAGYRDEEIMRQGRWHSSAFKLYCKTGRASRLREQRDLALKVSQI